MQRANEMEIEGEEESFAKRKVIDMIQKYGNVVDEFHNEEHDVYTLANHSVVRLKCGHARIPECIVQEIALFKMEMSMMEYDYCLGEML